MKKKSGNTPSKAERPAKGSKNKASAKPSLLLRIARLLVATVVGIAIVLLAYLLILRFAGPPGTPLMVIRGLEGESVRRNPVSLNAISPHLVRAVIAAEDSRFCEHDGFDFEAIQKALEEARDGGRRRGASTLSQQVAKNVFLWPGGGWIRKGAEAGFTLGIETTWTKRRIMEVYLNIAEWGDGLFGAEAASRVRFGKSAKDLTAREAALLAAVLPSPNRWRAVNPGPYVSRRAATIEKRMAIVRNEGLADCVLVQP